VAADAVARWDRSADVTSEAFMADETLRRASVRSLEIIDSKTRGNG
jgi:hypothetical protein